MKTQLSKRLSHQIFWTIGAGGLVALSLLALLTLPLFRCQENLLKTFLYEHPTISQMQVSFTHRHPVTSCLDCHLPPTSTPKNIDATIVHQTFQQMALLLVATGCGIILLSMMGMSGLAHYLVLQPIHQLLQAGQDWQNGKLDTPISLYRYDELGRLADLFNYLTNQLQAALLTNQEQKNFFQAVINAIPHGIRVTDSYHQSILTNYAYEAGLAKTTYQPLLEPLTYTEYTRSDGGKTPVEVWKTQIQSSRQGQMETFLVESVRDLTKTLHFSHEQKLASLGQLAAGIAHEIHNPLASIRLALQCTLRTLNSFQPNLNEASAYLGLVDKQIDKCIAITQRLLKLATPSTEQLQLISLNEVVSDTVALITFEGQEKGVTISTHFVDNLNYRVLTIESDLRMLIFNLLQNALNAMPTGGQIEIQIFNQSSKIFISIQDTGVGIPAHFSDRIFEPFFSYRPHGHKGSGLGLAICKSIVERYEGCIEVVKSDSQGTQFLITLPAP